ncbi:DUF1800 domain-containing protein [Nocardioides caeni]|uniref:DUF1800 domain-containing protein n=1 Tax=Nocardioides caeni TaxID=574700 RepID=A0A4S8NNB8_9ACTN|nr:DUF1800 domain-containing protein [Nocardioides caeni]THV18348.1 DUF1800 domain-containing protein [Nocardioides caeni]
MSFTPRPYRRTVVPPTGTRHALQRLTAGYTPALARQVRAAGGFGPWLDRQLADGYDDRWYANTSTWWPSVNASYATIAQRNEDRTEEFWRADANYECWTLLRRFGSHRQVRETMADFWEHHLHVPANGEVGPFRASYGKTVRGHALGRFRDLLKATTTHPAMSVYLTNANSTKSAPNENLGRELLELHTVGRGNYTEDDVKASARILTGYRVGLWQDWSVSYDPSKHWTGPVQVMDFHHANAAPDGRPVVAAYLDHLARHPATARRIALKLARRFVSDTPSDALVRRLATVYLANDTAIRPVLRSLVASSEFKASAGRKVRTPAEDVVATWRALGTRFTARPGSSDDESGANAILWQVSSIGLRPLAWQRPDGRPDTAEAWSSTSRFLASLDVHYTMSGGWWPSLGTGHRRPASWLPQRSLRFDHLVDHLARSIHGRGSTALLLEVACQATGLQPATVITADHALVKWDFPRLLTVFLDCPTHLTR